MSKIDFKKTLAHLYKASSKAVTQVDVPRMHYLMIDGSGDPNTSAAFEAAVEALSGLAYTIKFIVKKAPEGIDYGVMPLEGLWWAHDMAAFCADAKSDWLWTLMIAQPEFVTAAMVEAARDELRRKKNPQALAQIRFEALEEGPSAQVLHVGPYSEEGPTIARLHQFIADAGRQRTGKHHEIYLSDMRRTEPAKWKTILRQPMR